MYKAIICEQLESSTSWFKCCAPSVAALAQKQPPIAGGSPTHTHWHATQCKHFNLQMQAEQRSHRYVARYSVEFWPWACSGASLSRPLLLPPLCLSVTHVVVVVVNVALLVCLRVCASASECTLCLLLFFVFFVVVFFWRRLTKFLNANQYTANIYM